MKNDHVKEILSIMAENGKDTSALTALLDYVTAMETHLNKAYSEVQTMQRELSGLREEHNHPVRSLLQTLENNINEAAKNLNQLKEKIVDGCKNAVTSFKQIGVAALNNMAHFFKVKPALEALQGDMNTLIKKDLSSIAKIETISAESHAVSRHLKNIIRAYRRKEPIQDVKPNGKITQLLTMPYRSEIKSATEALENIKKAIARLDRLDRAATVKESTDTFVMSAVSTGKAAVLREAADNAEAPVESVANPVGIKESADIAAVAEKPADKTDTLKESANKAATSEKSTNKTEMPKTSPKRASSSKESADKTSHRPIKESTTKAPSASKSITKIATVKKSTPKPSVIADLAKHVEQVKNEKSSETAKVTKKVQSNPEL